MKQSTAAICLAASLPVLASAQSRYQSWQAPEGGTQEILDELGKLVDEAEKSRAADPRFLSDLKALIRRHETPWHTLLISEDFRDGDFAQNPTWVVATGQFRVDYGDGLVSTVAEAPAATPKGDEGKAKGKDVAIQLLGQLLAPKEQAREDEPAAEQLRPAEIYLPQTISNAFAISVVMSAHGTTGEGEVGVYQGQDRQTGYALVYRANEDLVLLRRTGRGEAVVQSGKPASNLFDGQKHAIAWTRHPDGSMAISVDGTSVFETVDRGFKDPFQGFRWLNHSGEYVLHSLRIDGT